MVIYFASIICKVAPLLKFYSRIEASGINCPEIVVAQCFLETGFLNSKIYKQNNNLFGLKHPSVRETTSLGVLNGHAYYDNIEDCITDYCLWQKYWYAKKGISNLNMEEYYLFLANVGYAEDPKYIPKLKSINLKLNRLCLSPF